MATEKTKVTQIQNGPMHMHIWCCLMGCFVWWHDTQYWSQCIFVIQKWHCGLPMTGLHTIPLSHQEIDTAGWCYRQQSGHRGVSTPFLACHVSSVNLLSSINSTVHQGQTWQIWYCLTLHSPLPWATVGPKGIESLDNSPGFWFLNECVSSLKVICRTLAGSW